MDHYGERWLVPSRQPWRSLVMGLLLLLAVPLFIAAGLCEGAKWWLEEARYALRMWRDA